MSEKRDSNPRPRPWQGRALPAELFSQKKVRMKGLEPPRLTAPDPKSGVATNYTTSAIIFIKRTLICVSVLWLQRYIFFFNHQIFL